MEHAGFALTSFMIFELDFMCNYVYVRTWNSVPRLFDEYYPLPDRTRGAQQSVQATLTFLA